MTMLFAVAAVWLGGCDSGASTDDGAARTMRSTWEPAEQLTGPGACCLVAVVDGEGTATIAWQSREGGVQVRQVAPGEPPGRVEQVGVPTSAYTDAVALGVDGDGRVTAVWDEYLPSYQGYRLLAADRGRDGSWSAPVRLAVQRSEEAEVWSLRLAENAAGDVVVVSEDGDGTVLAVTRTDREWSADRLGYGSLPVAAISENGVATVAHDTYSDGVKVRRRDGRRWSRAPDPPGPRGEQVAIDAGRGDEVVVMWRSGKDPNPNNRWPPPNRKPSYTYATARYDDRWTGFTELATGLGETWDEHVIAADDGNASFTWTVGTGRGCGDIVGVHQPAAGQPAVDLQTIASGTSGQCARRGAFAQPSAAASTPAGDAVLTWFGGEHAEQVHVASMAREEDGWSPPEVIGAEDGLEPWEMPTVAIGDDGTTVAAWFWQGRGSETEAGPGLWTRLRPGTP